MAWQGAWAQAPAPPVERSAEAAPAAAPSLGQKYDGVALGNASKNPLPSAPAGAPHLVWTGFQMTPSGSRVFLQTSQVVSFDVKEAGKKGASSTVSVVLRGCRIHMANNRRRIDTRYFATPVAGLSAKARGRDVEVQIKLRESVAVAPRNETGPDGTQFLVMDFPPGKASVPPTGPEDAAGGTASLELGAGDDSATAHPRRLADRGSKPAP